MKIIKQYGGYYFTINGKDYAVVKNGDFWQIVERMTWYNSSPVDGLWNTPPFFNSPIAAILWWKKHCKEYL